MINKIRNKLSIRIGFITGVIVLILFNILLLTGYYELYLEKTISNKYQTTINELENHLNKIATDLTKEENIDTYLSEYIKDKDITIAISDSNNKEINTYSNKDTIARNSIKNSKIINFKDEYYLITVSKKEILLILK